MTDKSSVYFGSVAVLKPEQKATLPAKLKRILEKFDLKKLCGDGEYVPIKMHLGGGNGYSTIHPLLVRVVADAIKEAGGKPVAVDGYFDAVATAHLRGYTQETIGCPLISAGGLYDSQVFMKDINYRSLDTAGIFSLIYESKAMINLSHVKGHGVCGYGGACKNIAMGCVDAKTRGKIHALEGGIEWDKSKCTFCANCEKACANGAITVLPKEKEFDIFFHNCKYCQHCILACPKGALIMNDERGFRHFQEGMALVTKSTLEHIAPERLLHINVLTNLTMFCDCWGITTPSLVPDIGITASHDIVAIEQASLDLIKTENFIEGSLIGKDKKLGEGTHLLEKVHGKDPFVQVDALERHGLGKRAYDLKEVF